MLHILRHQEGEIHPFHSLAVSLPALGRDLGKGSREAELTIYLPFIFGRDWSGIKVKISLLHDEISNFFGSACHKLVCSSAPRDGAAGPPRGNVINIRWSWSCSEAGRGCGKLQGKKSLSFRDDN